MRASCLLVTLLLSACGGPEKDEEIKEIGTWDSVVGAMSDAVVGDPSQSALNVRRHFDQAGLAFDYPAPLRLRVDHEGYPSWTMTRGDFELEVHAPGEGDSVESYVDMLVQGIADDGSVRSLPPGDAVHWCGQDIAPVRRRIRFVGDHHELLGFDLPDGAMGVRFMVINDMLIGGEPSRTRKAVLAALDATLDCGAAATE